MVIPTHQDIVSEISSFNLLARLPVYARIDLKQKKPPLYLNFTYHCGDDLDVYLSTKRPAPDQKCMHRKRPNQIVLKEKRFKEKFLYISFVSDSGISFSMKCKHGNLEPKINEKKINYIISM